MCYSFRNSETGKFVRQPNIKQDANRIKDPIKRFEFLKKVQQDLSFLLRKGGSPYLSNAALKNKITNQVNLDNEVVNPEKEAVTVNVKITDKPI